MWKAYKITGVFIALLMMFSAVAQAQDAKSNVRPYVGVSAGAFGLEFKNATNSQQSVVFGSLVKLGLDIGDYLGVEVRFGGTTPGTKNNIKLADSYLVSYLAKLQYSEGSDFTIYALAGSTTAQFKRTVNGVEAAKRKTGLSYGGGINYFPLDQLGVGVEWVQYWSDIRLGNNFGANNKARIWGAVGSLTYRFK